MYLLQRIPSFYLTDLPSVPVIPNLWSNGTASFPFFFRGPLPFPFRATQRWNEEPHCACAPNIPRRAGRECQLAWLPPFFLLRTRSANSSKAARSGQLLAALLLTGKKSLFFLKKVLFLSCLKWEKLRQT